MSLFFSASLNMKVHLSETGTQLSHDLQANDKTSLLGDPFVSPRNTSAIAISLLPTPNWNGHPWYLAPCGNENPCLLLSAKRRQMASDDPTSGDDSPLDLVENCTTKSQNDQTGDKTCQAMPNSSKNAKEPKCARVAKMATPGGCFRRVRRTKTSYDPQTRYQLNVLLYESFGNNRKPTKSERYRIQKETGITSRRLTYWLSDHKHRYATEISEYKRLSEEGKIDGYDSFIQYCNRY
ncbi:hypothetical protein BJV82DRAFT_701066 [Fennellomyces sp. T-0311]|nr:hypothetical protein BJV82DRAFT_701066 [Fennellomyces sp. T-0311]